ncbi:4Fe-4S dicluster domain-containing protein, partial [bacterium]|nr:4Fe-4S dicluster domain-containing protein [bacterium]
IAKNKKINVKEEFCKECGLCKSVCPKNALSFQSKLNSKGFHSIMWNDENCTFCGMCFLICPDCALEISEDEEVVER